LRVIRGYPRRRPPPKDVAAEILGGRKLRVRPRVVDAFLVLLSGFGVRVPGYHGPAGGVSVGCRAGFWSSRDPGAVDWGLGVRVQGWVVLLPRWPRRGGCRGCGGARVPPRRRGTLLIVGVWGLNMSRGEPHIVISKPSTLNTKA